MKRPSYVLMDLTEPIHPAEDQNDSLNYRQFDSPRRHTHKRVPRWRIPQRRRPTWSGTPWRRVGTSTHPNTATTTRKAGRRNTLNLQWDRKNMQLFINQWELYWGVNNDNPLMINPY